jgi:predicted TIM-barrel fold metal-dependent hydrolase
METQFEAVIGLEIHVQLQTLSKAFSADSIEYGALPNTQVSPISLGHPGTLPMHNKAAIDNAINPRQYIGKYWIDSLVHDKQAMQFIIDVMGEDNICMGSDYPFPIGEHHPGKLIEEMNFTESLQSKLLYQNACQWLGIS